MYLIRRRGEMWISPVMFFFNPVPISRWINSITLCLTREFNLGPLAQQSQPLDQRVSRVLLTITLKYKLRRYQTLPCQRRTNIHFHYLKVPFKECYMYCVYIYLGLGRKRRDPKTQRVSCTIGYQKCTTRGT